MGHLESSNPSNSNIIKVPRSSSPSGSIRASRKLRKWLLLRLGRSSPSISRTRSASISGDRGFWAERRRKGSLAVVS
jgi:hypothetical protein